MVKSGFLAQTKKLGLAFLAFICANSAWAETDFEIMEKARMAFAAKEFPKAINSYSAIPASSDFWLDALEERAWSELRQGEIEKALADLHSITSPVWSAQVGPETYLLSTFVSLKICAYKDVLEKMSVFKKRMLPRVATLEKLIAEPLSNEFWQLSTSILENKITMSSLGKKAEKYPRYFYRDLELIQNLKAQDHRLVENRMKKLALQDLSEIERNLKKMKIIDVELMQKILLTDQKHKQKKSDLKFLAIDKNKQIIFPVTDQEVWIDEVGHFQVKADQCPFTTRKTL